MDNLAFTLRQPARSTPLVVEVPHAGLRVDEAAAPFVRADARSLRLDADLYVDELFARAPELGVVLVCARMSRHVVELNAPWDERPDPPPGVPDFAIRMSAGGQRWTEPRPPARERERRRAMYQDYHRALERAVADARRRHGLALLLSAHSFIPTPLDGEVADVVVGTRGGSTAAGRYVAVVERAARDAGLSVAHDVPRAGGFVTQRHGDPDAGVHAIQIEIVRGCYLARDALAKKPEGFARVQGFAERVMRELACCLE